MQLSDEQILNRLNESWRTALGLDPGEIGLNGERGEITNETTLRQLGEWVTEGGCPVDGGDVNDVLFRWLSGFGIAPYQWMDVFGDGFESPETLCQALREWPEEFRIRQVTDYLKRQLAEVSFEPVNICGDTSGPAGAFLGIRQVVDRIKSSDPFFASSTEFGPSTPIDEVVYQEDLTTFWQRMQLYALGGLPELRFPVRPRWFGVFYAVGLILVLCICGLMIWLSPHLSTVESGAAHFLTLLLTSFLAAQSYLLSLPLYPDSIRTFRDLSEYMSQRLHQTSGLHDC